MNADEYEALHRSFSGFLCLVHSPSQDLIHSLLYHYVRLRESPSHMESIRREDCARGKVSSNLCIEPVLCSNPWEIQT